ncbi:MAG: hypothetical protein UW69_C0046G0007 [Microgenomates group bacterium GW2011_GWA2_44_7]|nr:MAG: hypothetical protein UW69_C0046G0007 [Microgenomates group bacterium GW2011_GWA2_44_7]KKT78435.1 MAG: hypothetical protein UW73_C0003G0083 [Microgenomates group bacterium GW2011_GWB1_44_8]
MLAVKRYVRLLVIVIFILDFVLVSIVKALAVNLTILEAPEVISADSFIVKVLVEGAEKGLNYLRVDLFKEGTNNYFGDTFNGTAWYGRSKDTKQDPEQYYQIIIGDDHKAQAEVRARIGDPSSSEYTGDGKYKLRIQRFTKSGSYASKNEQTPVEVSIMLATPTPTTAPTPSITPTVSPSPRPSSSSGVTSLTPIPVVNSNQSRSKTPTPTSPSLSTPNNSSQKTTTPTAIIGIASQSVSLNSPSAEPSVLGTVATNPKFTPPPFSPERKTDVKLPLALSVIGVMLLFFGLSPIWWKKRAKLKQS